MPLTWLPEDDKHPIRPDLPVFRHLTFTEVHAIELGIYIGLLAYFGYRAGYGEAVITLLISITRFTISDGKSKSGATKAGHRMGFHDVRQEPQYFGTGVVLTVGVAFVATAVWAVIDIGAVV